VSLEGVSTEEASRAEERWEEVPTAATEESPAGREEWMAKGARTEDTGYREAREVRRGEGTSGGLSEGTPVGGRLEGTPAEGSGATEGPPVADPSEAEASTEEAPPEARREELREERREVGRCNSSHRHP
jgi:hypothetical protein